MWTSLSSGTWSHLLLVAVCTHVERVHIVSTRPWAHCISQILDTFLQLCCVGWFFSHLQAAADTTQKHGSSNTHTNLTFCKPFPSNSLWLPPLTPRMLPSRSCPKLVPSQLTVGGSGYLKRKAVVAALRISQYLTPHRSCVCGCGIHRLPGNQPKRRC